MPSPQIESPRTENLSRFRDVLSDSPLLVKLTGKRFGVEPVGSLKRMPNGEYVLRSMEEHDIFGIKIYAGDTLQFRGGF